MSTKTLAADTASGVYEIEAIPAGADDLGDDFIAHLRDVSDGEVIYASVSDAAAARIEAEYGIRSA